GAMAFMPLLDMALEIYEKMSTFEDIHIEEYKELNEQK
ncbi:MAG: nicotinate-nucleotide--dimethylbenzimidazole phosphoribosyltransferase, partial [Lachnospiraceae bacterium]|nr:nicotinate-nucleotide--dimethylbenzimidazole phosphoribosyltransferase [Lachnospiraceae bacterium]